MANHEEVLMLVERHRLAASGMGWIDAHLPGNRALAKAASRLGVQSSY